MEKGSDALLLPGRINQQKHQMPGPLMLPMTLRGGDKTNQLPIFSGHKMLRVGSNENLLKTRGLKRPCLAYGCLPQCED
jgi:hypothetical protein